MSPDQEMIVTEQGSPHEIEPTSTGECDPQLLARLLAEAGQLLGVEGAAAQSAPFGQLGKAVEDYVGFKSILPYYGTPKQQKQSITRLVTALNRALAILEGIAPEYMVELEAMIERASPEEDQRAKWDSPAAIRKLRDAGRRFLRGYDPKKGAATNLPLEEAIKTLVPIIEEATGGKVAVSQNKNKPGGPSLNSPEVQAIGVLLQGVDRSVTTTAIVNMIEKVRRQPEQSESHLDAISRADPLAELDMSLHPGRDRPERARFLDL
jgi:hypothetical protein